MTVSKREDADTIESVVLIETKLATMNEEVSKKEPAIKVIDNAT